jgi:hypothetical protein
MFVHEKIFFTIFAENSDDVMIGDEYTEDNCTVYPYTRTTETSWDITVITGRMAVFFYDDYDNTFPDGTPRRVYTKTTYEIDDTPEVRVR